MKTLRWILVSFLAVFMFQCAAVHEEGEKEEGETKVQMEDLPAAVQETVRKESQGFTLRGFAEETEQGETVYEVELEVQGHKRDVTIDPDGEVVMVEEEVSIASLPEPVGTSIQEQAGGGTIVLVESITERGRLTAYEAQVDIAGRKSEVKVDPQGNVLP